MRVVLLLSAFVIAVASGLSCVVVQSAEEEQLEDLAELSDRASEVFADRFEALNSDVLELARRVSEVTRDVIAVPATRATLAPPSELDSVAEEASAAVAVRALVASAPKLPPLEVRWRQRLEASFRELAESRPDVLDVTYLGRFTGVPNGSLMVVRLNREPEGRLETTEVDPRSDWDAEFLQRVIQSEAARPTVSAPLLLESGEEARYAVMRAASSVRGDDGAVVGLVLISVELSSLLSRLQTDLPEGTVPLLVADDGTILLHPATDLRLARVESGSFAIDSLYPDFLESFNAQEDAFAYSEISGDLAIQLLRFDIGGEETDARFSLVLAAPQAEVEIPSPTHLAELLAKGLVPSTDREWLATGAGLAVAAAGLGLAIVRRRRRQLGAESEQADEPSIKEDSVLATRAGEIEAENRATARVEEVSGVAPAAQPGDREELPDLIAEVMEEQPAEEFAEPRFDSEAEDTTDSDIEHAELEQAKAVQAKAQDAPEPTPALAMETEAESQAEHELARADEALPAVSATSLASAKRLAAIRNRLEDELAESRQRALGELAAARERFEQELAHEREIAIERLVLESRKALASELGERDTPLAGATFPPVEAEEFDVRQLLAEVAAWIAGENYGRSSGFDIRCKRDVPDRLLGDPEWMGPLLVNLSRNAVSSSGGEPVELLVSCVDDGASEVRLCFELRASDIGRTPGREGKTREWRLSGLELTEEIVESMRGELMIEDRPGVGAFVKMVVPLSLPV